MRGDRLAVKPCHRSMQAIGTPGGEHHARPNRSVRAGDASPMPLDAPVTKAAWPRKSRPAQHWAFVKPAVSVLEELSLDDRRAVLLLHRLQSREGTASSQPAALIRAT